VTAAQGNPWKLALLVPPDLLSPTGWDVFHAPGGNNTGESSSHKEPEGSVELGFDNGLAVASSVGTVLL